VSSTAVVSVPESVGSVVTGLVSVLLESVVVGFVGFVVLGPVLPESVGSVVLGWLVSCPLELPPSVSCTGGSSGSKHPHRSTATAAFVTQREAFLEAMRAV